MFKKPDLHLFVYGSLMFEEVWQTLVKGQYSAVPARILGYRRTQVVDDVYPVIRPARHGKVVPGLLYLDVAASDLQRVDQFEGHHYERRQVSALLDNSFRPTRAQTYVLRDEFHHLATQAPWDPQKMRASCCARFLQCQDSTATAEKIRRRKPPTNR